MNKQASDVFPSFIFATTMLPLLAVLTFFFLKGDSISAGSAQYLLNSLAYSAIYSLSSYLICLLLACAILLNLPLLSDKFINFLLLFFIFQLQLGVIPKLYGYLGAYSVSGLWGMFSSRSVFSYSSIGVSVSLFYVYSPFFFIPFLSSIKGHGSFSKNLILRCVNYGDRLTLFLKIYRHAFLYSSILFLALSIMDFTCSDLVGGGKFDAYGKALYRTAIYFRDYFSAFVFGVSLLTLLMIGLGKLHHEK